MATTKLSDKYDNYTVFEENQVLTNAQLNSITNYLDQQERLTRVKLIGVGIVCGLELTLQNNVISVSKGAAVTTDGDLLHLDETRRFTRYRLYTDENGKYPFFTDQQDNTIPLYELTDEADARGELKNLATFERSERLKWDEVVALLYLESYVYDPDICTGAACDNLGQEQRNQLRVLLVNKGLLTAQLKNIPQLHAQFFAIDEVLVERVPLRPDTIGKFDDLSNAYRNVINTTATNLAEVLPKMYPICKAVLGEEFSSEVADPTKDWVAKLKNFSSLARTNPTGVQYIYDHLKDLSDTFNEFRDCLYDGNSLCCPDVNLFPKHVMLGELKITQQQLLRTDVLLERPDIVNRLEVIRKEEGLPTISRLDPVIRLNLLDRFIRQLDIEAAEFRHGFYASPAMGCCGDKAAQARFLFHKLNYLLSNFQLPATGRVIKITPGMYDGASLSERPIPFYYSTSNSQPICDKWNYEKYLRRESQKIYSFLADQYSSNPAAREPLKYSISKFPFFRVEGHVGMNVTTAEAMLEKLITDNNLPIKVESLQLEREVGTIRPRPGRKFDNFYYLHDLLRNDLASNLTDVQTFNKEVKQELNQAIRENALPTNIASGTLAVNFATASNTNFDNLDKEITELKGTLSNKYEEFDSTQYKAQVQRALPLSMNANSKLKEVYAAPVFTPYEGLVNNTHIKWLDWIGDILETDLNRRKELSVFAKYLQGHPGMEHEAGVVRGGTFILVYTSNNQQVVADFMLPYICDEPIYEPPQRPVPPFKPAVTIKPNWVDLIKPIDNRKFEIKPNLGLVLDERLKAYDSKFNEVVDLRKEFTVQKDLIQTYTNSVTFLSNQLPLINQKALDGNLLNPAITDPKVAMEAERLRKVTDLIKFYNEQEKVTTPSRNDLAMRDMLEKEAVTLIRETVTTQVSKGNDVQLNSKEAVVLSLAADLAKEVRTEANVKALATDLGKAMTTSTTAGKVGLATNLNKINANLKTGR